jgi:hypothetical protein
MMNVLVIVFSLLLLFILGAGVLELFMVDKDLY